jgi:hypothetical protein
VFDCLIDGFQQLSDLYSIGKHYQPSSPEQFAQNLASSSRVPPNTKLKDLIQAEFEILLTAIEKLCGFLHIGNEEFLLLPKIAARIECPGKEDLYLIGKDLTLTQHEAINWIASHRLDGVIVHHSNGDIHFLLATSESQENNPSVIVFAHSQGAAIAEHALALLSSQEKQKIRIFTFGGWSFIPPGVTHTDSHNYASVGDLIPRVGSFNLQYLALRRYEGFKEGLSEEEIIQRLSFGDAIHDLDCLDPHILERYTQGRCKHYRSEFEKISNVTVLDSGSMWEHSFNNESYQNIVNEKIEKYRKNLTTIVLMDSQKMLIESFV